MMGGYYPGDYDPDPEFLPHWQSQPMETPRTGPEKTYPDSAYLPYMLQEHMPEGPPPLKHTAASERALHAFDQIAGPMFAKHGLGMVLEDIRTQLHRMRPYGDWQDNEREALEQARLSVVNAIDLLSRLEHP